MIVCFLRACLTCGVPQGSIFGPLFFLHVSPLRHPLQSFFFFFLVFNHPVQKEMAQNMAAIFDFNLPDNQVYM